MPKRYNVKRYVKVKNNKLTDTSLLLPHVECYFIDDETGRFYFESTEGYEMYLGKVIKESNDLADLLDEEEA